MSVEARLASYDPSRGRPVLCSAQEWALLRPHLLVLLGVLPAGKDAKQSLTAALRLLVWASRQGLDLTPAALLSHAVIEAFTASLESAHSTYRAALRRLASLHGVALPAPAVAYERARAHAPYTPAEITALLECAKNFTRPLRRRRLLAVVLLGAGCGIVGDDLFGLDASCVHTVDDSAHVHTATRCVPALPEFQHDLIEYAAWYGEGPFLKATPNRNMVSTTAAWMADRSGVPALRSERLRSYFICSHLERGTPAREPLAICGLKRFDALDGYLAHLAPVAPCPAWSPA